MCDWKRWIWPGIIATVLLTALAAWWKGPVVEQDLQAKAMGELGGEYAWADVELDGRDLTLRGTAPNKDAIDSAINKVSGAYDVRVVSNDISLIEEQSPYVFSAEKIDKQIVLNGFVPSENERASTVEAAKSLAGGYEVVDNLQLGRGAPDAYGDAAAYAMGQLGRLSSGKASLSDLNLTVTGAAMSTQDYDAANAELDGSLPNGLALAEKNITPANVSPYEWNADYDGSKLVLSGYVPNEDARAKLMEEAKSAVPGVEVTDEMKLAEGASAGYLPSAGFALGQFANFSSGSASISGDDLTINGSASSVDAYNTAKAAVGGDLPENVKIASAQINPANVDGYSMTAVKTPSSVILNGFAPDSDTSAAIEAAAKENSGTGNVVNNLKIAAGVPDGMDWSKAAGFAVASLKGLDSGNATISQKDFSVEGTASSQDSYDSTLKMLDGDLDGGMALAKKQILPPVAQPYEWSVVRNSAGVAVKGHIPDTQSGEANIAYAKRVYGTDSVEDGQTLASGTPTAFGDAVTLAMQATGRLADSEGRISDTSMYIKGEAENESSAKSIGQEIDDNLPSGYTVEKNITFKAPPAPEPKPVVVDCQALLSQVQSADKINFDSAKATIKPESNAILDMVVEIAGKCPDSSIQVDGHTDATGSHESNMKLSQARADAVVGYLVNAGVSADRLTAKGYGPDRPVGDNKTEEGKAKNRRIEFKAMK